MKAHLGAAVVAGALLVAAALPAAAAPAPLDLRAAVRYALDHDPTVLARRATLAQDEADFARLHASEFPQVAGTLQNQLAKSSNASGAFQQYGLQPAQVFSQNTAQIGATYTIFDGSATPIAAQEAKRRVEAARSDVRRSEQQLAGDVAAAFYDVARRRDAVRLTESDAAYQRALLEAARAQEKVGRVAGVDVLRAQVATLRSDAALATARSDEATARDTLALRTGTALDTPFAIPVVLPEPPLPRTPLEALIARARESRPDIAGARAGVAVARLVDAAIESDRLPKLAVTAAFGNQSTPSTYAQRAAFGIPRGNPGFWQLGATETFSVPLLEYGSRRARHHAARAQLEAAQATLASTETGVEADVRGAYRAAATAAANLATAREAERLGSESARIAQLQYRNGLISLTDAAAVEQSALQAANELVGARVAYLTALVRLRTAVGVADPVALVDPGAP